MLLNLQELRHEYAKHKLDITDVNADPLIQFEAWFQQAMDSKVLEPNAMVLSTLNLEGKPSARVVLLKEVESKGFVFYTNYESKKGQELARHPFASLVFNWLDLHRQIRIEGKVEKITPESSTAYFQSRPKGSQIGAWASPQSQVIQKQDIVEAVQKLETQYKDEDVLPRPAHWGGYILTPTLIEFWQGRPSRLHDRIQYRRESLEAKEWTIERLAP